MPHVPEAYLQARRTQIIEAAYRCFAEKGFQRATMRDICKAAGLSRGAVYNYFPSKDDIITASGEEDRRRSAEMIASAAGEDVDDPLGNLARVFLSLANEPETAHYGIVAFDLVSESSRNPEIAERFRSSQDTIVAKLVDVVRHEQARGSIAASLDPQAIAMVLTALFQGFRFVRVFNPTIDVDAFYSVCDAIFHGRFAPRREA